MGIALTDKKSNLKFVEILGLQTTPSQWKSRDAYFNGRVSVFHGIDAGGLTRERAPLVRGAALRRELTQGFP